MLQYWHDSLHEEAYVERSSYIADINNEGEEKNQVILIFVAKQ